MPRRAIFRTILVTIVAVGMWVTGIASAASASAPTALDPPAAPACCQIGLTNFPARFDAGAPPKFFAVEFVNNGRRPVNGLQLTFTFGINGGHVNDGQIHLQRQVNGDWHNVNVGRHGNTLAGTDNLGGFGGGIAPGATAGWQYRLSFGDKLPNTQLSLMVFGNGRVDGFRRGQLAKSPTYQAAVLTVPPPPTQTPTPTPTPTPKPTPTATPTQTAQVVPTDTTAGTAPSDSAAVGLASGGGSGLWLAYLIGALLLLAGIGVIGTMLWRRAPQRTETEWPEEYEPAPDPYGAPPILPPQYPPAPYAPTQYTPTQHRAPAPRPAEPTATYGRPGAHGRPGGAVDPTEPMPR